MLLSHACEYAIQLLLYLQTHNGDRHVPVAEISREQGIPPSFLAKIVWQLASNGLLDSRRGAGGGVRLARNSSDLRLIDVVDAIDGPELRNRCIIGLPNCGTAAPCPFHNVWGPLREQLISALSHQDLSSLMQGAEFRISRSNRRPKGQARRNVRPRARKARAAR